MNRRDLLTTTGAIASLGLCAGIVAGAPGCNSAPGAEPIGAELAAAIKRYRAALAVEQAALEARRPFEWAEFDRAKPSADARAAFKSADEAFQSAAEVTFDALDDIAAVPIHTLADMRAKAAFLSAVMPRRCSDYNDTVAALLASMGGAAELSDLTTEPDPLLAAVEAYRRACAEFEAVAPDDDDGADAARDRIIHPQWVALKENPPAATTEAGAVAALRLAWEEMNHSHGSFERPLVGAALAYFKGRA